MPIAYKVLGQASPSANTDTSLLTVASGRQLLVSTIVVCNTASTACTYRIAVRPDAETLATKHYIAYDASLPANSTDSITIGLTVDASDVITIRSSNASTAFGAYGGEIQ